MPYAEQMSREDSRLLFLSEKDWYAVDPVLVTAGMALLFEKRIVDGETIHPNTFANKNPDALLCSWTRGLHGEATALSPGGYGSVHYTLHGGEDVACSGTRQL